MTLLNLLQAFRIGGHNSHRYLRERNRVLGRSCHSGFGGEEVPESVHHFHAREDEAKRLGSELKAMA